jgi:hypothetical protein
MQGFATQLQDPNNCGDDYTNGNPTVIQAYNGLVSYKPMYQAGCQKDNSGSYCTSRANHPSRNEKAPP